MTGEETPLGFLARPRDRAQEAARPGVVMIHDVWGLSDHTRDLAGRLAEEGFAVLAVDLYRRLSGYEISDPGAWIRDLDDAQVLADLDAAAAALRAGPSADRPIALTGFCMGGTYALLAACSSRGFAAAVPFYGMLSYATGLLEGKPGRSPLDVAKGLACPLLAFFGARDSFIPLDQVRTLEQRLPESAEVVVYPEAGHAFLNDTRPDLYRPEAAADAWRRTVDFLRAQTA